MTNCRVSLFGLIACVCIGPRPVLALLEPPPSLATSNPQIIWQYAAFGHGIGLSNIQISTATDRPEIILGGGRYTFGQNEYWYVLRYNASTANYDQVFVSPIYPVNICRILLGNVAGSSAPELVVALRNGEIFVYDAASRQEIGHLRTAARDVSGLAIADWDGDGACEMLLTTYNQLFVFDGAGVLEWQYNGVGGTDVVVGQMDADPAMEIATSSGHVLDGTSRTVQWFVATGFGYSLEVSDFDNDGMKELVGSQRVIRAYDVDTQLLKWSLSPTSGAFSAIHVENVDNDTADELLVGVDDLTWTGIRVYDLTTLAVERSIPNPDLGVTDFAFGNVDQDGVSEVIWGAGNGSTGPDHLHVGNLQTQTIEWSSVHLDGPFLGPEIGDLDGDGISEIVSASFKSNSGYASGRILVFDGRDFHLRAMSDSIVTIWMGIRDLCLRDVDRDGKLDILVASDDGIHGGTIRIFGFSASNQFILKWSTGTGHGCYSVDAADVDNDGRMEIVGGTGWPDCEVTVYDYATGIGEWQSRPPYGSLGGNVTELELVDTDHDGRLEILALAPGEIGNGTLWIFDGVTRAQEGRLQGLFTSVRTVSVATGYTVMRYILLGDSLGHIDAYGYQGTSYTRLGQGNFAGGSIDGFTVGPAYSVWTGNGGVLSVYLNDPTPLWQSANHGVPFGTRTVFMQLGPFFVFLSAGSHSVVAHAFL